MRNRKRVEIKQKYIDRIEIYLNIQNKKYNQEWTISDFIDYAIREKFESDMVNQAEDRNETQFWQNVKPQ